MLRKIVILFLFPIALFSQTSTTINPNGYNVFYYDSGKISSEGTLTNGKPDGYWKTYHPNGKIKSEGNRSNFELDGVWKFYNDQGIITTELEYKKGKKYGNKKTFDDKDGSLIFSENFGNDIKQGNSVEYFPPTPANTNQVKIKKIIPFVNGIEEGTGFEYNSENVIITITQYKMGYIHKEEKLNRVDKNGLKQGVWKEFYTDGAIKKEMYYVNDKLDGYLKEYLTNGNLFKSTLYSNGSEMAAPREISSTEIKTERYKNGAIKTEGAYIEGKPEGIHREFSEDGIITKAIVYKEGEIIGEGIVDSSDNKQGMWNEYFKNGKLRAKGKYLNNKRIGEWTYYFENGSIEQYGNYDNRGKAQGIWKWYFPCQKFCKNDTGNIRVIETYVDNKREGDYIEYNDSNIVVTKGKYFDNKKEGFWTLKYFEYQEEGSYIEGKRDGEWKHYYVKTGKLRFKGKFIDDEPDGKQVFYYQNGNIYQEGNYVGGLKEGEWIVNDESGILILTINFKNGVEMKYDGVKSPQATSAK